MTTEEIIRANRALLRQHRPDLYARAVGIGHIVTDTVDTERTQAAAARVEAAVVSLLCAELGIRWTTTRID